jgi:hypothetical protein
MFRMTLRAREMLTAKTPRRQDERGGTRSSLLVVLASWRFNFVLVFILTVFTGRAIADDSAPVPFYYAVGTIVEPQITTLVVGVNENVGQAVRSNDQKYVSLGVDTSLMGSAGVQRFRYQRGGLGFVGSAPPAQNVPGSAGNGMTPSIAAMPSQIAPPVSVLDKRGMVLVTPLER